MEKMDRIGWEIRNDIGIITIDNPPENYLAKPDFVAMEVLEKWTSYDYLRGLLITGTGKQFSGGGKLEHLFSMINAKEDISKKISEGKKVLDYIENLNIPVISAIQGICFGAGLEIALSCHIRICSENALFAFPETNHGLLPGLGGTIRLHELIGFPKSLKMILGGDMINAEDALEMKLVDFIVPKQKLHEFSFNFLLKLTKDRPLEVIHAVMEVLRNARTLTSKESMKKETRLFCELALAEARRKKSLEQTR
jgi:enoyl-CoA hydratase/carnithine racemase